VRRSSLRHYGRAARSFTELLGSGFPGIDPDALAFLFVGPLIYFCLSDWLTGAPKLGIDNDRLIQTWTRLFEPLFKDMLQS
jgi:hypothetical protein